MIDIRAYSKKKDSSSNTNNGTGFANYSPITETTQQQSTEVNGVYLWGQYHDHTGDVNGNMSVNGSVNATSISATNGNILYLTSTDITTQGITADILNALTATIDTLTSEDITVENLTVTKAAHFFKLIIDEVKAAQGQIILTPANAVIDKVIPFNSTDYKCYFKATDGDKKILQCFEVNDQLVCQTFNVADGVSYDISNKYYWRKVVDVSSQVESVNIGGEYYDCHWFVLSDSDKDTYSNAAPEAGDEVVLLGNRTDTTRQAAITIGAYDNPFLDNTIKAPFIIQYDGINNYNLSSHRKNVISRQLNFLTASNMSGNNLLNTSKWTNADMSPCEYDKEYFNYSTTATEDLVGNVYYDAFSEIIYIEEGTYTFSYYTEFYPTVAIMYSSSPISDVTKFVNYITPTSSGTVSGDEYQDNPRKYVTFTVASSGYICISVGLQDEEESGLFQKPQLEYGDKTTLFDDSAAYTQSQILMTKDEIDLSLAEAGINIQNDNVTITGNLRAIDDAWYFLKNGKSKIGGFYVDEDKLFSDKGISNGQETTYNDQTDFKANLELDGKNAMIRINGQSSDLQIGSLDFNSTTYLNVTKAGKYSITTQDLHDDYLEEHISSPSGTYTINNLADQTVYLSSTSHKIFSLYYDFNLWGKVGKHGRTYKVNSLAISITTANNNLFAGTITVNDDGTGSVTYNTTTYPSLTVSMTFSDDGWHNNDRRIGILRIGFNNKDIGTDDTISLNCTPTFKWLDRDEGESYRYFDFKYKFETQDYSSTTNTSILSDKGVKFVQSSGLSRLQFDGTSADMICNGRGLTINNSRTKQVIQNVEYPLTKISANKRYGNVEIGAFDEFIVIDTNSQTTLDLSASAACYDGHVVTVKALNGQSIRVIGSVIDYDESQVNTNKTWNDKIPRKFIYCGNVWYICKLG